MSDTDKLDTTHEDVILLLKQPPYQTREVNIKMFNKTKLLLNVGKEYPDFGHLELCDMTDHDILEGVRDLLADADNWIQGDYAKTSDGSPTTGIDPEATSFCMLGAVQKVTQSSDWYLLDVVDFLSDMTEMGDVVEFNDAPITTHEDVILLLKNALYNINEAS